MPAVCGDGVIEGTEQCDLGKLNGTGVGCDSDCAFDCMADADCNTMNDPCDGTATCVAATVQGQMVKRCMPGTPLADGTSCGANLFCVKMNCVAGSCGDGVVEAPEECDDGNSVNGDGCDTDCKFSCVSSDPTRDCVSTNACVGNGTCDDAQHTCTAGSNVSDGTGCGSAQICVGGTCIAATCGDGFVTPPEQCDFGMGNNVAGSGCQPNCTFSCTMNPNSCDDGNPCNGTETCGAVTGPTGTPGQKCAAGTPLADGTSCGGGKVCKGGVCSTPSAVCGNGVKETGEQCDLGAQDGTGVGCSSTCQFDCQTSADCTSSNACVADGTCVMGTVSGQDDPEVPGRGRRRQVLCLRRRPVQRRRRLQPLHLRRRVRRREHGRAVRPAQRNDLQRDLQDRSRSAATASSRAPSSATTETSLTSTGAIRAATTRWSRG